VPQSETFSLSSSSSSKAEDDKKAFAKWKQVVFSGRQWIVKSNTPVSSKEPTVVQQLMDRLGDQESL